MSELTLLVLKLGFLALLWVFVFMIVYALRSDLFGHRARRMPAPDAAASPFPSDTAAQAGTLPQPPTAPPVAVGSPVAPAMPTTPTAQTEAIRPGNGAAAQTRLVITSGTKEGLEIALEDEQLTIGRSGESGMVIRDDYTSTHHARLLRWDESWMVQDLDSTNGTFVDGVRIGSAPVLLPLNTEVRIGTTTFELRR